MSAIVRSALGWIAKRVGINVSGSAVATPSKRAWDRLGAKIHAYTRAAEGPVRVVSGCHPPDYMAKNRDGESARYARFVAIPSSNFISNAWRTGDDASVDRALSPPPMDSSPVDR